METVLNCFLVISNHSINLETLHISREDIQILISVLTTNQEQIRCQVLEIFRFLAFRAMYGDIFNEVLLFLLKNRVDNDFISAGLAPSSPLHLIFEQSEANFDPINNTLAPSLVSPNADAARKSKFCITIPQALRMTALKSPVKLSPLSRLRATLNILKEQSGEHTDFETNGFLAKSNELDLLNRMRKTRTAEQLLSSKLAVLNIVQMLMLLGEDKFNAWRNETAKTTFKSAWLFASLVFLLFEESLQHSVIEIIHLFRHLLGVEFVPLVERVLPSFASAFIAFLADNNSPFSKHEIAHSVLTLLTENFAEMDDI